MHGFYIKTGYHLRVSVFHLDEHSPTSTVIVQVNKSNDDMVCLVFFFFGDRSGWLRIKMCSMSFSLKQSELGLGIRSVVTAVATHIVLMQRCKKMVSFLTVFKFLPSRYAIIIRWCALCTLLINSPVKRNYYTKWVVITPGWHYIPFPCPSFFYKATRQGIYLYTKQRTKVSIMKRWGCWLCFPCSMSALHFPVSFIHLNKRTSSSNKTILISSSFFHFFFAF